MADHAADVDLASVPNLPATRGYQQEMLDESLRRNIIIAMDTGSGKTHIAVLRLKIEVERQPRKICWFFAPTVALCDQQCNVIKGALPVSVGLISGSLEPNQWKDASLWKRVLDTHRIVVSTPQVMLDALRHSYINMGRDIALMVFDEAHHAKDKDPYNMIMQEFYYQLYPRDVEVAVDPQYLRPMILGLTASPIYGGDIAQSFKLVESNLDSTIRTPHLNREELARHVHRPVFKHALYISPSAHGPDIPFSTNLASLSAVIKTITIDDDPYVKQLRKDLAKITPQTPEYYRLDQKLSKVIRKENSFTLKGLRDFERAAEAILMDLGEWATDWYVWTILEQAKAACGSQSEMPTWQSREKRHLAEIIERIHATPVSYYDDDIVDASSHKVIALVQALVNEKEDMEDSGEAFSGLIFVRRRDTVVALTELLTHHPVTKASFQVGSLVGTSDSSSRHAFLDLTRKLIRQNQEETLSAFRLGDKNLLIATSVAEEGIDVQACGCVIRWDVPDNMVSWLQSRGRARRKRSTFIIMFPEGSGLDENVAQWERKAREIVDMANKPERLNVAIEPDIKEYLEFRQATTGALLTLDSAIQHLNHFVAVHPNAAHHTDFKPLYDIDPPELPTGWHSLENRALIASRPYQGPWAATVTLPKFLPPELRVHKTKMEHPTKSSAQKHAAFKAYKTMYDVGLLDDKLLPLFFQDEEIEHLKQDVEKRISVVKVAPQINAWLPLSNSDPWYRFEVSLGSLPTLLMFTRRPCPPDWLVPGGPPPLYVPHQGQVTMVVRDTGRVNVDDIEIRQACEYTRRLFWSIHGSRMTWGNLDFSYLFFPTVEEPNWEDRRAWQREEDEREERVSQSFDVNAEEFGRTFWYPTDISIVKNRFGAGKGYKFVSWRYDELSPDEFEVLKERYDHFEDIDEVPYPLLVVEPLPSRTNLLLPFAPARVQGPLLPPKQLLFIPKHCTITLISETEAQYVYLLPSAMRALSIALTTQSLKDQLFTQASPLYAVPAPILSIALTAPTSQEPYNYQRLETLGDTVLKYLVSIQLLSEFPLWHEGYLSKRKDHAVSNVRLANENIKRDMFKWIIRDRLLGKKWKPAYQEIAKTPVKTPTPDESSTSDGNKPELSKADAKLKRKKKVAGELSTKVLADVVESTIGAAYLHGGMDLGYECTKFFELDLKWKPLPERITDMLTSVQKTEAESRIDVPEGLIADVEKMLNYTFKHKLILLEALTHASHQQDYGTTSYERMEFLGDAVMDMIVTDYLYRAEGKNYSPGHMHLRKSAVVNGHILAYFCLRCQLQVESFMPRPVTVNDGPLRIQLQRDEDTVYLWKCLLHSSSRVLQQQKTSFDLFKRLHGDIEDALLNGKIYPWAALTKLQAPKFLSDMMESLLGAVYLDAAGDLDVVRNVMRVLGIVPLLERIVRDNVDVLHPVSRLSVWASRQGKEGKKVKYAYERSKGSITCVIKLDDEILEEAKVTDIYRGKLTELEVKFAAAEEAVKFLDVKYTV